MVLVLKNGDDKTVVKAIEKKLFKHKSTEGFNAKKFNGTIKLEENPLSIQKNMRDEWQRNLR
ncbi:MAG: hypothetical protein EAZ35_03215 [Sphingobacteriia bacterium]|jgi:hypothetical protein|nr:MAG: hypothetical protein EAZ35_03215 [Sphingobacteriia bacterium]